MPHRTATQELTMVVRVDLNISLDGFATTTDQTPESPFGEDWARLVGPYTATRTFRERVLHQTTGTGTTGVDDKYAAAYFEGIGAEIMGAGMFGLHNFPDDPGVEGLVGRRNAVPVPGLHPHPRAREPIDMPDGTRFEFLTASPQACPGTGGRSRRRPGRADRRRAHRGQSRSWRRGWWTGSTWALPRSCWAAASISGKACAAWRTATGQCGSAETASST